MKFKKTMAGVVLSLAGGLALSGAAFADGHSANPALTSDEIILKDGSRILGTVTGSRDGVVSVDTSFAGTVTIALDQIESLRSHAPQTILLSDKSVIQGQPLQIEEGRLISSATNASFPVESLSIVNPEPWELGQGYQWTGLVNFALVLQRGNTDTDQLDYRLESAWRSTQDRYRFEARGEQDESNGIKNADNWRIEGKYDYFLDGPNYWGLLAFAEQDEFADLDLRYGVGPYIGRQFFTDPVFTMSGEFGLTYVVEEFDQAEDEDYPGANWSFDITSNYLGGDSQLYLKQFGLWDLDDTSNVIVDTTVGVAFPLLWNLEGAAEILWEYDSGAVDGVEDLDETYRFRVGYSW